MEQTTLASKQQQQQLPQHKTILAIVAILTTLLIALGDFVSGADANSNQQLTTGYIQRPDVNSRPQLMVAIYCAPNSDSNPSPTLYHNQYLDIDSRKWRSDRDPMAFCTHDKQEVLNFCKKVYPKHDIRNIVESSRPYKIDNWCKLNANSKRRCRTRLIVKPYRCLEGTFQSDALLVPERCLFDHEHNKSICESSDHWNSTALTHCHSLNMKLQSYSMLQPCGLGVFSGVEFVCCPANNGQQQSNDQSKIAKVDSESMAKAVSSPDGNSFAQPESWPKETKYDAESNNIKTDDEKVKKHHAQNDGEDQEESDGEDDEEDEYEDDEDEYDDDSSSWNGDKGSSSAAATTTSTTTTTTTTTTERPIDHYLSHFDLVHEHDEFRRAELAVEENYRNKITHVMKEWSQLDGHCEEMKKTDPQAAENFKKRMTHQFRKTIEALEEEGAAQRHQLASMHAERAMAIINRRKKAAMDCLTQALDRMPIRTRQVERCIVKLLKSLEKDRTHTLRQYKNLLTLNTREALREKKIILDHLVTLNRAANQSIAMLDRSPVLVNKLKNKIVALWHKLRNVPLDEPIVRESELKIMEKYEEEVAQHKIEREHQRLIDQEAVQDTPQESPSKLVKDQSKGSQVKQTNQDSSSNNVKSISSSTLENRDSSPEATITNKPKTIDLTTTVTPKHLIQMSSNVQGNSRSSEDHDDEIDNEIHYQIDSAKFSHLKADSNTHEIPYIIRHEPLGGHWRFGYPTLLVSACTIVVALALIGFKYYGRNSTRAYRRQGFAEVGRSCPEEKNVTNMQFNGYENPAYKFFEAEA